MAVDLFDLVEPLKRSVNPPGTNVFPDATDETFAGYLSDAFWEIRMLDMLSDWTEGDGLVTPISGSVDMPREKQSLILLWAAITIVTNELKNTETTFRAKGGPAEFETGKSAQVLTAVLQELQRRRSVVEKQLFAIGEVTDAYIDSIVVRDESQHFGDTWWLR